MKKMTENDYESAKGKYGEYKQAETIDVGIGKAHKEGNLEQMVQFVNMVFPPYVDHLIEADRERQIAFVNEAKENRNLEALTRVAYEANNVNTGQVTEEFKKCFSDSGKIKGVLENSPEELLVMLSSHLYNSDNDGGDPEFHEKHEEVITRSEVMGVLSDPKFKPKYTDLDPKKASKIVIAEYEANRHDYEDERLNAAVKNIDILFGRPERDYQKRTAEVTQEFVEELPSHADYLAALGDPDKFMGVYAGHWEREAKQAQEHAPNGEEYSLAA